MAEKFSILENHEDQNRIIIRHSTTVEEVEQFSINDIQRKLGRILEEKTRLIAEEDKLNIKLTNAQAIITELKTNKEVIK